MRHTPYVVQENNVLQLSLRDEWGKIFSPPIAYMKICKGYNDDTWRNGHSPIISYFRHDSFLHIKTA